MVLICLFLCRSSSLPLFFFPSSSSAYAPILISISSIVLRLISSSLFPSRLHLHPHSFSPSRLHPLPVSLPLNLAPAYAPIFIHLRCLSLSFCILNCLYPASFPFLALRSIPPGLLLYLIFHFLPVSQSCPASPLLLLWAILLCSRCSARRKYSLFAPPPLIWLKRQFVLF